MIKCKVCGIEKSEEEFTPRKDSPTGRRAECKSCKSAKDKSYREANREKLSAYFKNKYLENREAKLQIERNRYKNNPDKIKKRTNEYYQKNKDKIKEQRRSYQQSRLKTDPVFKITRNIRNRLWYALENKGWKKNTNFHKYIGISDFSELKTFLESNFTENMSWDNYGKVWDIDHIVPLSHAKNPEHLYKLQHYTNLMPMEKVENRVTKRDTFNFSLEYAVKLIEYNEGQEFLIKNHYSRKRSPSEYTFGLFLKNRELVGVCTFHTPFSPGLRQICGPEFSDQVIELNRLALVDFLPTNTESWFIAKCLNSGEIKKDIIVTFADSEHSHKGTIYQASNFKYLGTTEKRKDMTTGDNRHSMTVALSKPDSYEYRDRSIKHRYIKFNGNRTENKHYESCLKYDVQPYPK